MAISTNNSHNPLKNKNLDKYALSYLLPIISAEIPAKNANTGAQ
jgi:hypothetical protein